MYIYRNYTNVAQRIKLIKWSKPEHIKTANNLLVVQ